jgi:hypothetical protein
MPEAELYNPIKQFLEAQGYVVKGEIGPCDVVAVRGDEVRPVVVELKERLSLALILQAVDRLAVSDIVYVAFRIGPSQSASWRTRRKQVTGLLRRLGLGLLTVSARGRVVPVLDPAAYRPTSRARRRERLLKEFAERIGDPETGGSTSRQRVTVYRQDALRCARELGGPGRPQDQRATRADGCLAGRVYFARQPLWMVRSRDAWSLCPVAKRWTRASELVRSPRASAIPIGSAGRGRSSPAVAPAAKKNDS